MVLPGSYLVQQQSFLASSSTTNEQLYTAEYLYEWISTKRAAAMNGQKHLTS